MLKEIFNFKDFDERQKEIRLKNYKFSLKVISVLIVYFIIKFNLKYNYQKFNPIMIGLFIVILLSYPMIKKLSQNTFSALLAYYFSFVVMAAYLIFLTGALKAPGSMWLAIMPFVGATIIGRRGFLWGVTFNIIIYLLYLFLATKNIEMYPYDTLEAFQKEFRNNLFLFSIFAISITYSNQKFETESQDKISKEKEKNENLLKILFHDLANPLQASKMILKKILANRNPEENDKLIKQLDMTNNRVIELLEQVRKMRAIEDGKVLIELKPYIIHDAIDKSIEILEAKLKEKNINIVVKNSKDDLSVVLVDHIYFVHQVLVNILTNAIKFSEQNHCIYIEWNKGVDHLKISIRDEGIGMPQKIAENLFTENKELSRRGTSGEIGTGYGMSIVKTFMEQFRGDIEIESIEKSSKNLKHGTTIILSFPII